MRHLLCLALLLIASVAHGQTLELPAKLVVPFSPGRLITVAAKTDKKVTWQLVRPEGLVIEGIPSDTSISLGMPAAGVKFYVIGAIAGPDGKAIIAQCRVEVTGKSPQADDEPAASAPKRGAIKHCTLLVKDKATVRSLTESNLKDELARRGIELHVLAVADADADFADLHKQSGDAIVLQDGEGNLIPDGGAFRLPPDSTRVLEIVDSENR